MILIHDCRNKLRVSEHDPWFQTKSAQLSTTAKQLREMRSNLRNMAKMKRRLHEATNDFRTGLVTSMLVGGRELFSAVVNLTSYQQTSVL